VSLGRSWGYAGVELRLIDDELIDPAVPGSARARVKRMLASAGLPAVAVEFARLAFTGLELAPPGVVLVSGWRSASDGPRPTPAEVNCYGAVARKP